MNIKRSCYNCSGTGEVLYQGSGIQCPVCVGVGKLVYGFIEELDDMSITIDDIYNKCNDIWQKVNE